MKTKNLVLLLMFFSVTEFIFGQIFPNPGDPGTLPEKKKQIEEGEHGPWGWPKKTRFTHKNRRYKYHLAFWNECYYDPDLGCGWNKVGRVAFGNGGFGYNWHKLHVGWRAGEDKQTIRLSAYFHDCNGEEFHFSQELKTVHTDHQIYIDMFLGQHIIALIVDNTCFAARTKRYIPFPPPGSKTSFLSRAFYFGGTCTAPHDMTVKFYDQENDADGYSEWFNSRDYMTWNATDFEDGDKGDFYAYKTINGSSALQYVNSNLPCVEKQKCIVSNGANITFTAGENIVLHKGFHAKPGSRFVAKIETKKKDPDFIIEPKKIFLPPMDSIYHSDGKTVVIDRELKTLNIGNINNILKSESFQIYPNPSPGLFTLRFDDGLNTGFALEIRDMMGKVVFKKDRVETGNMAIDIREQPKGIYFVKVLAGGKVYTEKAVVE